MSAALQSLMAAEPPRCPSAPGWHAAAGFVLVGGVGAAAFVLLSTAMVVLDTGVADWMVRTLCYGVLIVPVYLLHRRISFRSDAAHGQALPRYVAVQGMALVVAALVGFVLDAALDLPEVVASTLVIGLTSSVNFLVLRSWVFARLQWATPAVA